MIPPNNFENIINNRFNEVLSLSNKIIFERFPKHIGFVEKREKEKGELKYNSISYGFKVMTNQEKNILIPTMEKIDGATYEVSHSEKINVNMTEKRKYTEPKQKTLF